ncbi:Argininosuccinate lyase [Listeria monocytogenes Lm_1880]|nr:Argininosuccinate lyase [Listeria monocytogenes Lm_1880]
MQDISLEKHGDNEEFIDSFLNLSIMTISIVCKDIIVEELDQKNISFLGEDKQ